MEDLLDTTEYNAFRRGYIKLPPSFLAVIVLILGGISLSDVLGGWPFSLAAVFFLMFAYDGVLFRR